MKVEEQNAAQVRSSSYSVWEFTSPFPLLLRTGIPMKFFCLLLSVLTLAVVSCQSTCDVVQSEIKLDTQLRADLLAQMTSMNGRWQGEASEGPKQFTEFSVSSGGSVVREIMMPGEPYEMTNMYSLDGNSLVMTHYCAIGNQPHMRAISATDGRLVFRSDGVGDLKTPDDQYMGEMTMVIVDENHVEQHWTSFKNGEFDSEMIIKLTRVE